MIDSLPVKNPCPGCEGTDVSDIYRVRDVPVHSCLLLESPDSAVRFPRGHVSLAMCNDCGLIANRSFDESLMGYTTGYEESQHFSPRFRDYASSLVDRLIGGFGMREKTILEIGCGKGDFLAMLCEEGENDGIGVDPATAPERIDARMSGRIRLHRETFKHRITTEKIDCIVCRHTLEHIPQTRKFLLEVYHAACMNPGALVFFEVPDSTRILNEGAFWDVYYEHCTYFTPGSLARTFRRCGFEIVDLWRDFDEQYLCLAARVRGKSMESSFMMEEPVGAVAEAADRFQRISSSQIDKLKKQVSNAARRGERVVVWGSGSKCAGLMHALGLQQEITAIVDINPHKTGKFQAGSPVEIVGPQALRRIAPDVVLVMNRIYEQEIRLELRSLDLSPRFFAL